MLYPYTFNAVLFLKHFTIITWLDVCMLLSFCWTFAFKWIMSHELLPHLNLILHVHISYLIQFNRLHCDLFVHFFTFASCCVRTQVLCLHLKRFKHESGGYTSKLHTAVEFPALELDLSPLVHPGTCNAGVLFVLTPTVLTLSSNVCWLLSRYTVLVSKQVQYIYRYLGVSWYTSYIPD